MKYDKNKNTRLKKHQQEAFKSCIAAAKVSSIHGMRYNTYWVYECLLIRIKSHKAYEHLRKHKILALPSIDTLNRYINKMDSGYGFHKGIFELLKKQLSEMSMEQRRDVILIDEMKVGEAVKFDTKKLKMVGFTDLGEHTSLHQQSKTGDHGLVIMFQPFQGNGKSKRSLKKTVNDEINRAVWDWFVKARSKNILISGLMLQEKSKDIAIKLGNTDFKGSNSWLEYFRKRHNISWNQVCGESNDFNVDDVNEWESKIGGKLSKERITVLLCGNMAGEMEKPLVIGKVAKPRCFKNIDVEKLPHIIIFLDNAACHPKLDLSNIKLAWFPPNTTSVTQPMDQGISYCVKLYYRRLLMQPLIANVDKISVLSELSKNITVLQAIQWLNVAVNKLKPETIKSCFAKATLRKKCHLINERRIQRFNELDKSPDKLPISELP
ncbi:hypothetical protein AGLY_018103 [Aphis glycines]|uniref:HTH CENPB-type domain-containing protein n=1 Tax=Aphis glycines TaxID=307491 RepID=A0A6G0SU58_APHGL|nr:hypothetical protein AGLY_018103 [Aphis glycines]